MARRLGRALGRVAHLVAARERRRAEEHFRVAFPDAGDDEVKGTIRDCFVNLGEHALELCVARKLDRDMDRHVSIDPDDVAPLDEALSEGKGCIVITGHIGSWELAARSMVAKGYEVVAVARHFTDRGLGDMVDRLRESGGVVALPRGAPGTVKKLLRQIRGGGALFMLIDQDTKVPSVFVPFFGRPAKTPRGPAELALRMDAPVVFGFIHRTRPGGPHRLRMERLRAPEPTGNGERDVEALTAAFNEHLEAEIRDYPADWVWFHKRWRSKPPEEPAEAEIRGGRIG